MSADVQWGPLLLAGAGALFAAALTGTQAAVAGWVKARAERKAEGRDHCRIALSILSGVTARGSDRTELARLGLDPSELSRSEYADLERERVFIPEFRVRDAVDDALTVSQLAWAAERWATPSVDGRQLRSQSVSALREVLGAYVRRDPLPEEPLQHLDEWSSICTAAADDEWESRGE